MKMSIDVMGSIISRGSESDESETLNVLGDRTYMIFY